MAHPGGRPRKTVTVDDVPRQTYYTVSEAANIAHVHPRTIRARLNDGTLRGKKLSGTWRIYPDSLFNNKVGTDLNIENGDEKQISKWK